MLHGRGPNDLGQMYYSSALQPYVEEGINNQLAKQGVQGATDVPPVTPSFANAWNQRVDIPLGLHNGTSQPDQSQSAAPTFNDVWNDRVTTPLAAQVGMNLPGAVNQPLLPNSQQSDTTQSQPDGQQTAPSRLDDSRPAAPDTSTPHTPAPAAGADTTPGTTDAGATGTSATLPADGTIGSRTDPLAIGTLGDTGTTIGPIASGDLSDPGLPNTGNLADPGLLDSADLLGAGAIGTGGGGDGGGGGGD